MAVSNALLNVFIGLLAGAFLSKKFLKRKKVFLETPMNLPLLLLFIAICISIFNSIDLRDTLKGGIVRFIQYVLVFFAVVEEIKDQKQIKRILISFICGISLVSIDSIWQVLTGKDFVRGYGPVINLGLRRATASFKDSNTLGIYLSALAPFIFGLGLYGAGAKGKNKFLMFFVSIISLLAIALTYSRPTLLAVFIALFFLAIAKKNKILISLLITLLLISPFILPDPIKQWAKEVNYNPLRFMCNDDRLAIYRNSLKMIKAHPIIGVGANTYMKNYKYYKESPEYRDVVTADYLYAHNNFLHTAAEIGLVGLSIFIWLIYRLLKECKSIYKHLVDRYLKVVSLSLISCLIAFLVNGLTESSLYYSRVALIFWYLAGFSLALKKFSGVS
jgi:putative inorganic carbon (HCO3(-)) transporter